MPLGIILTRNTKIAEPIIGVASVLQTIPSLALLVFLVPFMGTGKVPAIIALTIYGLLPILRNTYIGIRGVDRATVEAGIGMGMTSRQVLTMVELPLSLGVIMAGVRTATVLIVGVATIAGLIGAGGLGDLIFRGLQTYNSGLILAGAIPSALLAIVLDFILKKVEGMAQPGKLSRKTKKNITRGAIAVIAAVVLVFAVTSFTGGNKDTITITGKNFTEQEIMVYVLGHLIEEKTDLDVKYESFLGGSTLAFEGLQQGSYDVYVEYTGTGLMNYLKEDAINDPDEAYNYVKKVFKEKYDLVWLEPIGFNNTYTLTVRQEDADKYGLEKMSDLKRTADSMVLGTEPEFQERKDGYPGFQELYGFSFKEAKTMDTGIMYSAIKNGDVDVIDAFGTDGRIPEFNLKVLEDDKNLFPPYYAAPLIRQDVLDKHPELEEVLNMLAGRIDDERMQQLNARVDIDKEEYETVAVDFLKEEGLID
nr:glycine betaine ABC transporter substrate-binding protein [Sporosarcina sp. D27]